MSAVATTFRIDPEIKERLTKLSRLRRMPVNKIVNQALEQFVAEESLVLQAELEAELEELKRLRRRDPEFEDSTEPVARAELATADDPAQGEADLPQDRRTTDLVRDMLGA